MAVTAVDYARRALERMGWDEDKAVELLREQCLRDSDERRAFGNPDTNDIRLIDKAVRPAVRKALRQRGRR